MSWLHLHRLSISSLGNINHVIIFRINEQYEDSHFHRFYENDLIVLRNQVSLQWYKSSFRYRKHASKNIFRFVLLHYVWASCPEQASETGFRGTSTSYIGLAVLGQKSWGNELTFSIWLRQSIFWLIRQQNIICFRGWSSWFSSMTKSFPKVWIWISFRSLWLI